MPCASRSAVGIASHILWISRRLEILESCHWVSDNASMWLSTQPIWRLAGDIQGCLEETSLKIEKQMVPDLWPISERR